MNLPAAAAQRLDSYLRAVEHNLAHKSPAVRRELLDELRDHALEALLRQGGDSPTSADVERVLATMDAPECFAETPVQTPTALAPAPARASFAWLLLALGFLLVNAYGVWRLSHPPEGTPIQATTNAVVDASQPAPAQAPLQILHYEQVNVSAAREVTLRLVFSAAPNRDQLPQYLALSEEGDPELAYELVGRAGSNVVLIKTETVSHDRFDIHLKPGLTGADSSAAPGIEQKTTVGVRSDFEFQRMEANTPSFEGCELRALFNSKPDMNQDAASLVAVDPAVTFTVSLLDGWRGSGLRINGRFKAGGLYTVTLKAGLAAESGTVLDRDITRVVQFPDRPADLAIEVSGRYLSPRGTLQVPVTAVNLKSCEVSLQPVFGNNLVQLAHRDAGTQDYYGTLTDRLSGTPVVQTNLLSAPRNEDARLLVQLRDLAGPEPRGVYWMDVRGDPQGGDGRLLVVTDLGLVARRAEDAVLVWVNSLRDATAVGGVEVVLYGENNQEISRGNTDAQGLARLPRRPGDEPFVITARKEGDLTYLDLARTRVEQGEGLGGASYLEPGAVEANVFTERGVYRPGETVFLQALVRDRELKAPAPFPALFRVRKPDGRVFKDLPVTLDALGSVQTTVTLPNYLPTGRYTLELAMPGTFTVLGEPVVALEDFVPPQIRVDLAAPSARQSAGTDLTFTVKSEHLFGRAASGLKVNGFATIKAASFAPAAWKGWLFGDDEKPFSSVYQPLGSQLLDEKGQAEFAVETSEAWRPPAALQVVQQGVVSESSGRTVTSYGATPLDVYPFYIGLRLPGEGTLRVGETQRVSVIELTPAGAPTEHSTPLVMKLARVRWNSVLRKNASGGYEWKSERQLIVVREATLAADGRERAWPFCVEQTGDYLLLARDPDSGASTSLRFSAATVDQAWVEWSREKPDRIELALDRTAYRPGETARLLIKAPFSGNALLTVEADRVLDQRVITLEKNTAEIDVPVRAEYAPNVYCTLTLIRPAVAESIWSAHRAVGAVAMPVLLPDHRLNVAIRVAATNRPQAAMPVSVLVRDEQGRPVGGEVTFMAVDEAICMLTAFETPDPLAAFLAQRGLGVELYDLYAELMPVIEEAVAGASHIGGDGGAGLRRRLSPIKANRFKPVALWQSRVSLDTNGQATAHLALPEFNGELRVMAVAYNDHQAGSADVAVKVQRGLIVQPALPRFLAPGDTCVGLVELFNQRGADLPVRLRITCGGPLQVEQADHDLTLEPGGSQVVRLPLIAGRTSGKALCAIEVTGGVDTYRETIELAVRPASGLQVSAAFHKLAAGEVLPLAAPAGWISESTALTLGFSAQPALRLGRALDYVMHYPYGCLEQTVSGAFPLLYAADLAQRILPQSAARTDVNAWINAAILRVLSMQQADGSFSLWPYERTTDRGASLYAAHFLVEARKASYPVPADRLEAALTWLHERLDRASPTEVQPDQPAWADDRQERAYACYVLALTGQPDPGWNARLREQAPRLSFAAQVQVAGALLLSGEPRQATALLEQLALPLERPREIGGLLNSEVRDAALLLSTWLDVDPRNEAVPRLVQLLDRRMRDGHWGTTQDNAMALLGLGKYVQRVPAEKQDFTGALRLADGVTRALSSSKEEQLVFEPGAPGAVQLVNQGPGPMYVGVRYEGIADGAEAEVDQGLRVRRDFLNARGEALDPTSLTQGELVIVRLTLDTMGRTLDNLVMEELLPAGWEIENSNLVTAQQFEWLKQKEDGARARDSRDDRLLLFTGPVNGELSFYYAVRAVTPGDFIYPPLTAACMYEPEIRSVHGGCRVEVVP